MKLKTLYAYGVVLAILVAVYAGLLVNERVSDVRPTVQDTGIDASALAGSDSILVKAADGNKYALKKAGSKWRIDGKAADGAAVKSFLKALGDMGVEMLVTTNGKDLGKYGLKKPADLTLTAAGAGKEQTLTIGLSGAASDEFYLLGKDGVSVYLMGGDARKYLDRKAADWRAKPKGAAGRKGATSAATPGAAPGAANVDDLLKSLGNGAQPAR